MANRFWEKFNQGLETGNKIWEADAKRRMQADIAAANKMSPEMQSVGLQAPQAGQVPTGYEEYIQARPEGGFAPVVGEGLAPEQLEQRRVIAERFNAPTAFQGIRNSYTLGDTSRETEFTPDDVAQARMQRKAQIYSDYGREDLAEQMQTNALARKASSLQIRKGEREEARENEFDKNKKEFDVVARSALGAMEEIRAAQERGDYDAAAEAAAKWRTSLSGTEMLRYNRDTKTFEASRDAGKTWKQGSGALADVTNPKFFEMLVKGIDETVNERGMSLLSTGASRPELAQLVQMRKNDAAVKQQQDNKEREFQNADRAYAEGVRQFNQGLISAEKLAQLKADLSLRLQQLDNQGKKEAAQITANSRFYPGAFSLQGTTDDNVPVLLDSRTGQYVTGGGTPLTDKQLRGLNLTKKATGEAAPTPKQLGEIIDSLDARMPNFMKLEKAVQDKLIAEEWAKLQSFATGNPSSAAPVNYMDIVKADQVSKGLMPSGVPR